MADLLLSRRKLFTGASLALLTLATPGAGWTGGYPFSLGVASGEPTPGGFVLWTRLARQPLAEDGGLAARPVPVRWELAEDERFTRIVRHGMVQAEPDWGHSVHVELDGLPAGRGYFYRFIALGETSPTGRTRTAPARDALPERLRVCFGSCQKYEVGHYAAYRHMVADEPDLVLFLGDYIYEGAPNPFALRPHVNDEPFEIGGYRVRHATYRLDPLLQAAHAAAPWAMIWDDHEVANDYGAGRDPQGGDPAHFLKRRAAAYKAYWEHMPLRRVRRPKGTAMPLHRTFDWGRLARFQLLDDRQFRTLPEHEGAAASILGDRQERWLGRQYRPSARWSVIAQQTLMTPFARSDGSTDGWEGYPAARARLLGQWRDSGATGRLLLGGDIHSFVASDVPDPLRPGGPPVAAEFVGGSITSLNKNNEMQPALMRTPGVRFGDTRYRGYGRLDLRAGEGEMTFRGLADARDPDSAIADLARFAIDPDLPGIAGRSELPVPTAL